MDRKLLGSWGEERAADFLRKKGCKIIGMNYKVRFGEIDIIAESAEYLIFAEVKLRKNDRFAQAREFVTASKQMKIKAAASMWLGSNETALQPRFDVVEIYAPDGIGGKYTINHIENAFE